MYEKNGVEVIVDNNSTKWLNEKTYRRKIRTCKFTSYYKKMLFKIYKTKKRTSNL